MHFAPTDEQRQIQDSVARFVEKEYTFDARQKLAESDAGWSRDHWATFAELGLLGFPFSEDLGGFGGSMIDAGLIMEGFGKGVVVEAGVTIHSFSHLEGCTIRAGASVGPFARLRPGADIGEGAKIGFVLGFG